jgi:hypothetical protein
MTHNAKTTVRNGTDLSHIPNDRLKAQRPPGAMSYVPHAAASPGGPAVFAAFPDSSRRARELATPETVIDARAARRPAAIR